MPQLGRVPTGDEEEEEDGSREERLPSCFDYVMHFLTVFWKVLFACVPPTEYCHGWACFGVCILVIGLLTALIGDLASHFGCTVGLKDSVNAVVFVALGTSIPGKPPWETAGPGRVSEKPSSRAREEGCAEIRWWNPTEPGWWVPQKRNEGG